MLILDFRIIDSKGNTFFCKNKHFVIYNEINYDMRV